MCQQSPWNANNDHVIQLIPGVRGAQAYFYRGADGTAVIDPGYTGSFRAVLRFAEEQGIRPNDIGWVILTHHHIDHAGTAFALCEATGARLAVHQDDAPYLRAARPHFNDVAVLQWIVERDHPAVRFGADTPVADFGVDPVGEVNGRRTGGQGQHVAFGGKHEHLVPKDVNLDGVDEFLGVENFLLPVDQLPQPGKPLVHLSIVLAAAFLVRPVRCDSPLSGAMHLLGANLDCLQRAAVADHGRVQRVIAVGLLHGDVILESGGDGLPERVDHAQRAVAIFDRVGGDSDGRQVVDLIKVLPHRKFVRDAVHVLRTAGRLRLDTDRGQFPLENLLDVVDVGFALLPLARDLLDDLLVIVRMELSEGQVLQFPLDVPHPQPVCQWGVDVERLLRHRPAAVLGKVI